MSKLTDFVDYADAQRAFSSARLWELFSGDRENFNITTECVDRHASERIAIRVAHADGRDEAISFRQLSELSSRFAHYLNARGIAAGDRVAVMLEPGLPFYVSVFGSMKAGAIAVPLFTLFGPDALAARLDDCAPALLIIDREKAGLADGIGETDVLVADDTLLEELSGYPALYKPRTRADDMALFQYTSGTTRLLPAAVKHTHKALVVLMSAALYGTGIRPGDAFFCPSSPAWGHGMWHGTLSPLALGVTTGTMAGKFDAKRLLRALEDYGITNLSAAATHYRMMRASGEAGNHTYALKKLSFTGEPIDPATTEFIDEIFGLPVCSMYGTTEVGVVLVNYPGATDFPVKPGSLGKAVPGGEVDVRRDGASCPPGEIAELYIKRGGRWISTKDRAYRDEDGYFYHCGRADDVIISAGWTMSAVEIENTLLKHPAVREAAAIGVEDAMRGQVVKAFIVPNGNSASLPSVEEIQLFAQQRLSRHEYPRQIEFVAELPKTPAGKINRKALRDREASPVKFSAEVSQ